MATATNRNVIRFSASISTRRAFLSPSMPEESLLRTQRTIGHLRVQFLPKRWKEIDSESVMFLFKQTVIKEAVTATVSIQTISVDLKLANAIKEN